MEERKPAFLWYCRCSLWQCGHNVFSVVEATEVTVEGAEVRGVEQRASEVIVGGWPLGNWQAQTSLCCWKSPVRIVCISQGKKLLKRKPVRLQCAHDSEFCEAWLLSVWFHKVSPGLKQLLLKKKKNHLNVAFVLFAVTGVSNFSHSTLISGTKEAYLAWGLA